MRDALEPAAAGALAAAATWLDLARAARLEAAAFVDDADAAAHGARVVRVAILGARHLSRARSDAADASDVKAVAKAGLATMAGFARRLRAGDAPRLGVDGGDKPSPWARASVRLKDGREVAIGRTNTEYRFPRLFWSWRCAFERTAPAVASSRVSRLS